MQRPACSHLLWQIRNIRYYLLLLFLLFFKYYFKYIKRAYRNFKIEIALVLKVIINGCRRWLLLKLLTNGKYVRKRAYIVTKPGFCLRVFTFWDAYKCAEGIIVSLIDLSTCHVPIFENVVLSITNTLKMSGIYVKLSIF